MRTISFNRHRFAPEVIRHSVWLYAKFTLSFRDIEDLLAERGLDVSYETVRRWFLKFGSGGAIGFGARSTMKAKFWTSSSSGSEIRKPRES
jgi:putative transposase